VAGPIPDYVIQQIVQSTDIVRLVGRHCELKKKGARYWALCPFHKEKTPSFSVDPQTGLYYCFGCKEGGSVFTFLQKMEGLSFREALQRLASEAGVDLRRYGSPDAPSQSLMGRLRAAHELATSFYQKCLQKSESGRKARRYLAGRQISEESVAAWRLGYAPEGWDHFLSLARRRGFEPELLARAGLVLPRQGAPGHYDRFRNRLMFPIADATGRTIAFGARALSEEDEPKYLNSPETALFSKGRCFYGLDRARQAIRSAGRAVVLEGYTDVIMAHQAGVEEAVAVLGTALSEEHAHALKRLCEKVVLVFDADEAGQKSAARSIEVLLKEDLAVYVAELPGGLDPCDLIVQRGPEAFRRALQQSQEFFRFRLALAGKEHDLGSIEGRAAAFHELARMAMTISDEARRDMVVRWIARELDVRESQAWAYLERTWRRRPAAERQEGPALSADRSVPGELLGLLLACPELAEEAAARLDCALLQEGPERAALERLVAAVAQGRTEPAAFIGSLAEPELASAASRALEQERGRQERISTKSPRQRLQGYLDYLDRKRDRQRAMAAGERLAEDDRALMEYLRQRRERDKKSAQAH